MVCTNYTEAVGCIVVKRLSQNCVIYIYALPVAFCTPANIIALHNNLCLTVYVMSHWQVWGNLNGKWKHTVPIHQMYSFTISNLPSWTQHPHSHSCGSFAVGVCVMSHPFKMYWSRHMAANSHHVNSEKVVAVTHEAYFDLLIAGFFSLNLFCLFIKINIFNDTLSLYCYIITIITEVELSMQVFFHTITKRNTNDLIWISGT